MDTIQDPQFGDILDYQRLRDGMSSVLDHVYPTFNLMGSMLEATRLFRNDPNYMTACAASGLAYMMLVAAEEEELAAQLKGKIFTLGWTEEHTGTDLLSIKTRATPDPADPQGKRYHIKGQKWLINNSYHADYHSVIAKVDPEASGPRSLSIFAVPHSSTKNWERLDTHVLRSMVLTKFDIDGPGLLIGQAGRGLEILQRMALPSKYHCSYMGVKMVDDSLPAAIEHLSSKNIFGSNPIQFSNVFRQLYNLAQQAALINFTFFRALAFSDSPFLQFHGIMLKSWLLLKCNEILSQNLLVTGSKGFLKESNIGGNAIDSFVFPVFDGHYTLNTLLTYKHMQRYLAHRHPQPQRLCAAGRQADLQQQPRDAPSALFRLCRLYFPLRPAHRPGRRPLGQVEREHHGSHSKARRRQRAGVPLQSRHARAQPRGAAFSCRAVESDRQRPLYQRHHYAVQRGWQADQPHHQRRRSASRLHPAAATASPAAAG
ncbi:MAG: acyl-CoA/acyl-ACP dehydrogenase [Anaerolineae bacterium]|nr:acyl-CoA/acyl-ACP dehydrogenase [Anaerolineae bacterium]